jgi:hypothetical protein
MSPSMARKTYLPKGCPTRERCVPTSAQGDVIDCAIWSKVYAWWLCLCIPLQSQLMLSVVNSHSFLLDSSANYGSFNHPHLMLYQSDITTLVSFALVLA